MFDANIDKASQTITNISFCTMICINLAGQNPRVDIVKSDLTGLQEI
jgi:hypothetical protein